jgi:hypothetical protein
MKLNKICYLVSLALTFTFTCLGTIDWHFITLTIFTSLLTILYYIEMRTRP